MLTKPPRITRTALAALLLLIVIAHTAAAEEARIAINVFQVNSSEDLGYLQAGLSSLLPPRISVPGKITVIDTSEVRAALSPSAADYSLEKKALLARSLQLDYLLTGSITKIGAGISIDAFLFDAAQPESSTPLSASCSGLDSMIATVEELAANLRRRILRGSTPEPPALPALSADSQTPAAEPAPPTPPQPQRTRPPVVAVQQAAPVFSSTPFREYVIKHKPFISMAAGDLTGQGNTQLLFADHLDVRVYDLNPTELVLSATVPARTGEYIVTIDTFDLNNNGRAEIYVSSYDGHRANSFIAEYMDAGYPRLAEDMPWLMRTYTDTNGFLLLLGVKPGTYNPLYGTAFEFIWKDNQPMPAAEHSLPGGVSPFGSSRYDVTGDQHDDYVTFSRKTFGLTYSLQVMTATGRILWQDPQGLGGAPNSYPRALVGDGETSAEPIPLRVTCADVNADRRTDILVPRNTKESTGLLGRLGTYTRGEMLCLQWDGSSLTQNWSSGIMDGYISDFLLADIDGDGAPELLVLSVTDHSFTGKAKNIIRVYKQAPR